MALISEQLQNWFKGLRRPLFHEAARPLSISNALKRLSSAQRLIATLSPGTHIDDARPLAYAVEQLAFGPAKDGDRCLKALADALAALAPWAELPALTLIRRHNDELKDKLELMAALPAPTPQTHAADLAELRRLLQAAPDAAVAQLAHRWLAPGLTSMPDLREALCFLYPVPRSLLRALGQLAWSATRTFPEHGTGQGHEVSSRALLADYIVLKVLQCLTAAHTVTHSLDGPLPWSRQLARGLDRRGGLKLLREAASLVDSPIVLQSTYTHEALQRVSTLFKEAASQYWHPCLSQHADRLSPTWPCTSCGSSALSTVAAAGYEPTVGPLCTCVGLEWSWSELDDQPEQQAECRARRRCLWWAWRRSELRKAEVDVFEVLEVLQPASA